MSGPALNLDVLPASRHRITFGTSRSLAYVSVLELGTVWERTLRRAHVPVKYSQGYNPRPRMHFAAPLPVGCGSEADLLDVLLDEPRTPQSVGAALADSLPPDLTVVSVASVGDDAPALSEQLAATEYRVLLRDVDENELAERVASLVATESVLLPKRGRHHRGKSYNLRALIDDLKLAPEVPAPWLGLWMRLSAQPGATGRPDEVLKALGFANAPRRCLRTRLILAVDTQEEAR